MNLTARSLRSVGWMATLMVCAALVLILAYHVNGLRRQVQRSQAQIVALRKEQSDLETEFATRASQQQKQVWAENEFGYVTPVAAQYLENERQLAAFAKPADPGAPGPVRVASADDGDLAAPAMVSPMTGRPLPDAAPAPAHQGLSGLGDRLATVNHARPAAHKTKPAQARDAGSKPTKPHLASDDGAARPKPGPKMARAEK